jgi:hypothetical protein
VNGSASPTPASYRKVWLFGLFSASVVTMALFDKIGGVEALSAISGAFTAAMGLNVWEHRRARLQPQSRPATVVSPSPIPATPVAGQRPGTVPFDAREPGDDTAFDPQDPALDTETLARLLAQSVLKGGRGR